MNFFSKISFKSLSMENTLMINWKKDTSDEFVFASNTSIVSKHLIEQEMAKVGLLDRKPRHLCAPQVKTYKSKHNQQLEVVNKVSKLCHESRTS